MRSNLLGMCSAVAAVAVAGSANAGFVDNFNRRLANTLTQLDTITATNTNAGVGVSTVNTGLTGTAFPKRSTGVQNAGSSATMTGDGSAAFVLGRASTGSGSVNSGWWGGMYLNYANNGAFADLTGTTSFSINVGSYTGGATNWALNVTMDFNSEFDYGVMDLTLTNSDIVNGVLTFNVANMTPDGIIDWAKVDGINLEVKRAEWGDPGTTVSFSLSDFQYNVVPAPGAIALLGTAGLMGRRRRN